LLQRQRTELASFALVARSETALEEKIGRHVFEIAELQRVSLDQYNLRVWVVETIWTKLHAPHADIEPVSDTEPGTEFFAAETGGRIG
jgi:hypothetical protein